MPQLAALCFGSESTVRMSAGNLHRMDARGRVLTAAAATALAALLCGCSPLVERSYPGGPAGSHPLVASSTPGQVELPEPDLGPSAQWSDNGRMLAVTLGGSSSCPAEPEALIVQAHDRLFVKVKTNGGFFGACTTDLRFVTYEMRVPDGISRTVPVTVTVGDRELELPPRGTS